MKIKAPEAAITAFLANTDGGEIVERLRRAASPDWGRGIIAMEQKYTGKDGEWDIKGWMLVVRRLLDDCLESAIHITKLTAQCTAKDKRIAELEAALEPFAFAANAYDPVEGDDDYTAFDHQFSIGQLRRARDFTKQGDNK